MHAPNLQAPPGAPVPGQGRHPRRQAGGGPARLADLDVAAVGGVNGEP